MRYCQYCGKRSHLPHRMCVDEWAENVAAKVYCYECGEKMEEEGCLYCTSCREKHATWINDRMQELKAHYDDDERKIELEVFWPYRNQQDANRRG